MSQKDIKNPYFAFCAKFFLIHNPVYRDIICLPGKCYICTGYSSVSVRFEEIITQVNSYGIYLCVRHENKVYTTLFEKGAVQTLLLHSVKIC